MLLLINFFRIYLKFIIKIIKIKVFLTNKTKKCREREKKKAHGPTKREREDEDTLSERYGFCNPCWPALSPFLLAHPLPGIMAPSHGHHDLLLQPPLLHRQLHVSPLLSLSSLRFLQPPFSPWLPRYRHSYSPLFPFARCVILANKSDRLSLSPFSFLVWYSFY
jgi:hypothetical protein